MNRILQVLHEWFMVAGWGNVNHWTIIKEGFSSLEFFKWRRADDAKKVPLISFTIGSRLGTKSVERFSYLSLSACPVQALLPSYCLLHSKYLCFPSPPSLSLHAYLYMDKCVFLMKSELYFVYCCIAYIFHLIFLLSTPPPPQTIPL